MKKKITIEGISKGKAKTQYGEKDNFRVTANDGNTYSSFWNSTVASWQVGQEVEIEYEQKGKYFNLIFPKLSNTQSSTQHYSGKNEQLDRIEAKIQELLKIVGTSNFLVPKGTDLKKMGPGRIEKLLVETPDLPYAGDPHSTDKDEPSPF